MRAFPSRRKFSIVKSPRCPGYRAKTDTSSMCPAQSITSFLWTNFGQKKKKKTNMLPIFLASQPWICFSDDKELWFLKKKKKENRRILPLKNPATRIQMGFMVSFSQNHLARKDGNWDYIMCTTKLYSKNMLQKGVLH